MGETGVTGERFPLDNDGKSLFIFPCLRTYFRFELFKTKDSKKEKYPNQGEKTFYTLLRLNLYTLNPQIFYTT